MRKLTVTIVPNLISKWQKLETEFRGVRANSISWLILHLFDVYCSPWKEKKTKPCSDNPLTRYCTELQTKRKSAVSSKQYSS